MNLLLKSALWTFLFRESSCKDSFCAVHWISFSKPCENVSRDIRFPEMCGCILSPCPLRLLGCACRYVVRDIRLPEMCGCILNRCPLRLLGCAFESLFFISLVVAPGSLSLAPGSRDIYMLDTFFKELLFGSLSIGKVPGEEEKGSLFMQSLNCSVLENKVYCIFPGTLYLCLDLGPRSLEVLCFSGEHGMGWDLEHLKAQSQDSAVSSWLDTWLLSFPLVFGILGKCIYSLWPFASCSMERSHWNSSLSHFCWCCTEVLYEHSFILMMC